MTTANASRFGTRRAWSIAWRESRASAAKFLFVVAAVAMGVASLTGVKGFSRAFHNMLVRNARTLIASDLMVRVFSLPTPQQQATLDRFASEGVKRTWITETLTMLSRAQGDPAPILISVKAVDPNVYPFYGEVKLDPPGGLSARLGPGKVAVSRDLLLRAGAKVGDNVRIGGQEFQIAGIVDSEPDRMSGSLNVGPRVLMTRAGFDRTGLLIPGSRASERFLFSIPPGVDVKKLRADLKKAFPESLISDYREANPTIEQSLDRATIFLSLISLIALIVGAVGVAMAIDSHLQLKLDSIAIMKCLGARSGQVIRIYALQTLALGIAGGVFGIFAGFGVQLVFPLLLAHYFKLRPQFTIDPASAFEGLAIAVLVTLLFTLPPLLAIRHIRPGLILRREVTIERRTWRERVRQRSASLIASLSILIGLGLIAAWLSDSAKTGVYFVTGLMAGLLAMFLTGSVLLAILRRIGRKFGLRLHPSIRHGIANLYRPGAHTRSALTALGIGVMFTLTVFLVQRGFVTEMLRSAPPGMANVFLLDMTPANRAAVMNLVAAQKGVEGAPESIGATAARIAAINGTPVVREKMKGAERRYASTVAVTESAAPPAQTKIVSGKWWDVKNLPRAAEVSVSEDAAKALRLTPGMRLDWSTPQRNFSATIASVHRTESIRLSARIEFLFTPGTLTGLPAIYYGSVRVKPKLVPELQSAIYAHFPTVTVVNVADVMQIVQEVVDQISLVIRFISAFAILAGMIILGSSVAGTRLRRIREVVILKTLGGTRRRIAGIFSVEFLILGAVAGLAGSLLATVFSSFLLGDLLKAEIHFDWLPNLAAIVLTALVANATGWLASLRILSQRPIEVLREQ